MLTVDVKVNGSLIAAITAQNIGQAPGTEDKPGDFVGEMSQPRAYACTVTEHEGIKRHTPGNYIRSEQEFTVTHDRRGGWQGLLHKITGEILPTVVETIPAEEER